MFILEQQKQNLVFQPKRSKFKFKIQNCVPGKLSLHFGARKKTSECQTRPTRIPINEEKKTF